MIPIILASSLPEHPTVWDNLQYQTVGFLAVIGVLGALAVVLTVAGKFFAGADRAATSKKALAAAAPTAQAAGTTEGVPPELFAVIAAAVSVVLREPHAILAVEQGHHAPMDPRRLAWSMEGRRQIFGSHQVR